MDGDDELDLALATMAARGEGHRLSEVNPRNLAELFGREKPPADKAAAQEGFKPLPCAGTRLEDQLSLQQLAVCVRIRPPVTAGVPRWDEENCIHATSRHHLAIAPPRSSAAYAAGDRGQTYAFSAVFDDATSQEAYYQAVARPLVEDCLRSAAHSSVVLAYGITAAGKTFTLEGTRAAPGLVPRALRELFDGLAARGAAARVGLRYFEVYNESVHDLLDEGTGPGARPALRLKEDAEGRVFVAGLAQLEVSSADHALCLLRRGARQRARAETALNYASSRSHSIFQVALYAPRGRDGEAFDPGDRLGHMSFVDLAGSERAQRTGNSGLRLKESVAINSSLMTLGRCLEALRWNQQHREGPLRVLPYRESKVTHLFRDALHGYGQVVLSVNVSPCARDYDETTHVLRYAALASQISSLRGVEAPRRAVKAVSPALVARVKRKAALPAEARGAARRQDRAAKTAAPAARAQSKQTRDDAQREELQMDSDEHAASPDASDDAAALDAQMSSPCSQAPSPTDLATCAVATPPSALHTADNDECWQTPADEEDSEQVAALRAHVELLLGELRAAEERVARTEADVRAEVAAELGTVMEEMERNYAARLAAIERRRAAAGDGPAEAASDASGALHAKLEAAEASVCSVREELAAARQEACAAESRVAELEQELESARSAYSAQSVALADAIAARDDALAAAAAADARATAKEEALLASQERVRALEEELASQRKLHAEEQEQEAVNRAMEVELLEAAVERERKRAAGLSARLEVALAALAATGTPSRPLAAKLAAGLPGDAGAGTERPAEGTPHDVALARAREALRGAEGGTSGPVVVGSNAAPLRSRLAAAAGVPGSSPPATLPQGAAAEAAVEASASPERPTESPLAGQLRPSRPSTTEEAQAAARAVQDSRAERRRRRQTAVVKSTKARQTRRRASAEAEQDEAPQSPAPSPLQHSADQPTDVTTTVDAAARASDAPDGADSAVAALSEDRDSTSMPTPEEEPTQQPQSPKRQRAGARKVAVRFASPEKEAAGTADENQDPADAKTAQSTEPAPAPDAAPAQPAASRRGRRRVLQPAQQPSAALAAALGDWQEGATASSLRAKRGAAAALPDNPSRRRTRRQTALLGGH